MEPITVSQLNNYISKKLSSDMNLKGLPLVGEISGVSESRGHIYLSLKDSESTIRCAIWSSMKPGIDLSLIKEGEKVVTIGDISPYAKGGSYSFSIKHVESLGEGAIMAEFKRVKKLLEKEGLFDQKYKKPIPKFAALIGVVTSSTGAAIEDIKKIITQKNTYADIIIFPTVVQGIKAPSSICKSIENANTYSQEIRKIDVLIVGRGGGSIEDLAAFNDETVARTIFESTIPIISAVGHESDFSISDFVADVRAETPTAAADMAAIDTYELTERITTDTQDMTKSLRYKLQECKNKLYNTVNYLNSAFQNKVTVSRLLIDKAVNTLNENNPKNVLKKGYAAVLNDKGNIVSNVDIIDIDSTYKVLLQDGSFIAKPISKERNMK